MTLPMLPIEIIAEIFKFASLEKSVLSALCRVRDGRQHVVYGLLYRHVSLRQQHQLPNFLNTMSAIPAHATRVRELSVSWEGLDDAGWNSDTYNVNSENNESRETMAMLSIEAGLNAGSETAQVLKLISLLPNLERLLLEGPSMSDCAETFSIFIEILFSMPNILCNLSVFRSTEGALLSTTCIRTILMQPRIRVLQAEEVVEDENTDFVLPRVQPGSSGVQEIYIHPLITDFSEILVLPRELQVLHYMTDIAEEDTERMRNAMPSVASLQRHLPAYSSTLHTLALYWPGLDRYSSLEQMRFDTFVALRRLAVPIELLLGGHPFDAPDLSEIIPKDLQWLTLIVINSLWDCLEGYRDQVRYLVAKCALIPRAIDTICVMPSAMLLYWEVWNASRAGIRLGEAHDHPFEFSEIPVPFDIEEMHVDLDWLWGSDE